MDGRKTVGPAGTHGGERRRQRKAGLQTEPLRPAYAPSRSRPTVIAWASSRDSLPDPTTSSCGSPGTGSEEAFGVIVGRYHASLVKQCARVVGNTEAEDAAQETLLKGPSRHPRRLRGPPTRPVAARIAHNIAINPSHASRHRPLVAERDCRAISIPRRRAGCASGFQEVVAAVTELPDRQREAIVMRAFEGRSYEEISARLATTDAAVRQLLNRARAQLRAKLAAVNVLEPVISWVRSSDNGTARRRRGLGLRRLRGGGEDVRGPRRFLR